MNLELGRPNKPCIDWYVIFEDLYDDRYEDEKDEKQIEKEASEKACNNCKWVRACHYEPTMFNNGSGNTKFSSSERTPTPFERTTR